MDMRAIRIHEFGGPEVLQLDAIARPEPGRNEILVRIQAAGINYVETTIREGHYPVAGIAELQPPFIPGSEIAGVVEDAGADVTHLRTGDRVASMLGYAGGYAEYAVIREDMAIPVPEPMAIADALPLVSQGATAYVALTETGVQVAGRKVLIHGGSSGVGQMLIQLCRCFGAVQIIASSRGETKTEFLRQCGAHAVVDNTETDWPDIVRTVTAGTGVDAVFDLVGGEVGPASIACMAPRAMLIVLGHLGGTLSLFDFEQSVLLMGGNHRVAYVGIPQNTMVTNPTRLARPLEHLMAYASDGRLRGKLAGSYPLADAAAAHRAIESQERIGKIYLTPDSG